MDVEDQTDMREHALVRFHSGAIESALGDNVLVKAELVLHRLSSGLASVSAHRANDYWAASEVEWDDDVTFEEVATDSQPTTASTIYLDVTSDVLAFLDGSEPNYGWVITGDCCGSGGDDEASFSTQESANQPSLRLTVEKYQFLDTQVFAFDHDTHYTLSPAAYHGDEDWTRVSLGEFPWDPDEKHVTAVGSFDEVGFWEQVVNFARLGTVQEARVVFQVASCAVPEEYVESWISSEPNWAFTVNIPLGDDVSDGFEHYVSAGLDYARADVTAVVQDIVDGTLLPQNARCFLFKAKAEANAADQCTFYSLDNSLGQGPYLEVIVLREQVTAAQDSYVEQAQPDATHGSSAILEQLWDEELGLDWRVIVIEFDLNVVEDILAGDILHTARIGFDVESYHEPPLLPLLGANPIGASWQEDTITWATLPYQGTALPGDLDLDTTVDQAFVDVSDSLDSIFSDGRIAFGWQLSSPTSDMVVEVQSRDGNSPPLLTLTHGPTNECGGSAYIPFDQKPGSDCSVDCPSNGDGVFACHNGTTYCDTGFNGCGGCSESPWVGPGGTCTVSQQTYEYRCYDSDLLCDNGCGGFVDLGARPGDACGATCGDGTYVCDGPTALRCSGESETFCGDCEQAYFHQPCGTCGLDLIVCDDDPTVTVDATFSAPTADTWVFNGTPSSDDGGDDSVLELALWLSGKIVYSFVVFNWTDIKVAAQPEGTLVQALLVMDDGTFVEGSSTVTIEIHRVTEAWDESTTWADSTQVAATPTDVYTGIVDGVVAFDVTADIQGYFDETYDPPPDGWRLSLASSATVHFSSREGVAPPRLELTFRDSVPTCDGDTFLSGPCGDHCLEQACFEDVPADVSASAPPSGVVTTAYDRAQDIYSGPNRVQSLDNGWGVDDITPPLAAIIRGRVIERDSGAGLPGVRVEVLEDDTGVIDEDYGYTATDPDGYYLYVVNGAQNLHLRFIAGGHPEVQRHLLNIPAQGYVIVDDVALTPLDASQNLIYLGSDEPIQVARSECVRDDGEDCDGSPGERTPTVFFPAGLTATVDHWDGDTTAIISFDLRITELTVGDNGPAAMPGDLPALSAYTHAFDLTAIQAEARGGYRVVFEMDGVCNEPEGDLCPIYYVEDYLELWTDFALEANPSRRRVPAGHYNVREGTWYPELDGWFIEIEGVGTDGLAQVDPGSPANLVLSIAERRALADTFCDTPGPTSCTGGEPLVLWRVPLPHFSKWDPNHARAPQQGDFPNVPLPKVKVPIDQPSCVSGSVIEVENQVLREAIPLADSPYTLVYASDMVLGGNVSDVDIYLAEVDAAGESLAPPDDVIAVEATVDVAGNRFPVGRWGSGNAGSNPSCVDDCAQDESPYTWPWVGQAWDLQDVRGSQRAVVRVGYVYGEEYVPADRYGSDETQSRAFGNLGLPGVVEVDSVRGEVTLWTAFEVALRYWDHRDFGLGGWMLNVHHVYDPNGRDVYFGSGNDRLSSLRGITTRIDSSQLNISRILPDGQGGFYYIRTETDGATWHLMHRDSGTGLPDPVAGPYTCSCQDPPCAGYMTFGIDRNIYITTGDGPGACHVVLKVDPESGLWTTYAGTAGVGGIWDGDCEMGGCDENQPASNVLLDNPLGITTLPNGDILVANDGQGRILKVAPNRYVVTVAGGGSAQFSCSASACYLGASEGDSVAATELGLDRILAVESDDTGGFYFMAVQSGARWIGYVDMFGQARFIAGRDSGITPDADDLDGAKASHLVIGGLAPDPILVHDPNSGAIVTVIPTSGSNHALIAIDTDGRVRLLSYRGSGGVALGDVRGVTYGPLGQLIVIEGQQSLCDETCATAFDASCDDGGEGSATSTCALGTDCDDCGVRFNDSAYELGPDGPAFTGQDITVVSSDGQHEWVFDYRGLHQLTRFTRTGVPLRYFDYDLEARITRVAEVMHYPAGPEPCIDPEDISCCTDPDVSCWFYDFDRPEEDEVVFKVSYDEGGSWRDIGYMTLDAEGYLASYEDAEQAALTGTGPQGWEIDYGIEGLLNSIEDPVGRRTTYVFESGRFRSEEAPPGVVYRNLTVTETETRTDYLLATAEGRDSNICVTETAGFCATTATPDLGEALEREVAVTDPDGLESVEWTFRTGDREFESASGQRTAIRVENDPDYPDAVTYPSEIDSVLGGAAGPGTARFCSDVDVLSGLLSAGAIADVQGRRSAVISWIQDSSTVCDYTAPPADAVSAVATEFPDYSFGASGALNNATTYAVESSTLPGAVTYIQTDPLGNITLVAPASSVPHRVAYEYYTTGVQAGLLRYATVCEADSGPTCDGTYATDRRTRFVYDDKGRLEHILSPVSTADDDYANALTYVYDDTEITDGGGADGDELDDVPDGFFLPGEYNPVPPDTRPYVELHNEIDNRLAELTPPDWSEYIYTYTPVGLLETVDPPGALPSTTFEYTGDRDLDVVNLPENQVIDFDYVGEGACSGSEPSFRICELTFSSGDGVNDNLIAPSFDDWKLTQLDLTDDFNPADSGVFDIAGPDVTYDYTEFDLTAVNWSWPAADHGGALTVRTRIVLDDDHRVGEVALVDAADWLCMQYDSRHRLKHVGTDGTWDACSAYLLNYDFFDLADAALPGYARGRLQSVELCGDLASCSDNVTTSYQYGGFGQIAQVEIERDDGSVVYLVDYLDYDDAGRLTQVRYGDTTDEYYTYDRRGRLNGVWAAPPPPDFINHLLGCDDPDPVNQLPDMVTCWMFDDLGNRIYARDAAYETTTYSVDSDHRRTSQAGSISYEYDGSSRVTARVDATSSTRYEFLWDALNNLRRVQIIDTIGPTVTDTIAYELSPDGGVIGRIHWVGPDVDSTPEDAARWVRTDFGIAQYIYDTGSDEYDLDIVISGPYILELSPATGAIASVYAVASDHLGVRRVVHVQTGTEVQSFDYDIDGNITFSSGNAAFQPFRYRGGFQDPDTGLIHFEGIIYDPVSGITLN